MKSVIVLFLIVSFLSSCNTTKIVTSWRDPDVTVKNSQLNKFLVAALLKNQAIRRRLEDLVTSYFPGKAIQFYKELGETELKENNDFYNQKLKGEGFDSVVILPLLRVDKSQRYIPGEYPLYYRTWRGFYTTAWPEFYSLGYYTVDKNILCGSQCLFFYRR
jgi:hypothetical protein